MYHEVYVPFTDVYHLGGPEVFNQLERTQAGEKNLVVVPLRFVNFLDEMSNRENSVGAEETLRFLKHAIQKHHYVGDQNKAILDVREGLHIAILDGPAADEKFSVSQLEEVVAKEFPAIDRPGKGPVLLTSEERYHIKYGMRGKEVQDPEFLQASSGIVDKGVLIGNDELLLNLYENKNSLPLDIATDILKDTLYPNQFVRFVTAEKDVYARVSGEFVRDGNNRVIALENQKLELFDRKEYGKELHLGNIRTQGILGVNALDMEQYIALQYGLFNPDVSLFFLAGSQGSGKTLLSYAAAMDQVLIYGKDYKEQRGQYSTPNTHFRQIVVLKPNEVLGGKKRDIGALPGNLFEKIRPFLESYQDAHKETSLREKFAFEELLLNSRYPNQWGEVRRPELLKMDINGGKLPAWEVIEMTYSGFLTGRSFKDTLVLVDEAQNYTPFEVKTIIARMGEGCKCIVMGDPLQRYNPQLSNEINGFTNVIKHFLSKEYSGLVKLTRNYRHQMSEDTDSWKVYAT